MVVYYMFDHMGAGQVQKFREGLGNGRLTASMWTDDSLRSASTKRSPRNRHPIKLRAVFQTKRLGERERKASGEDALIWSINEGSKK